MPTAMTSQRHLVFTIATPNYLDQFLILGRSLAVAMPEVDLRVLVLQDCSDIDVIQGGIDEYLKELESEAHHEAITIDQVDFGAFDVESAVLFYNISEFATSMKPAVMHHFLRQGWSRVTYIDPDIQIFTDFEPVLDDDVDLSLTPHLLSDIPRDEFSPSTNDILAAGFFNLGFCSVRPSAAPFLDWWSDRLQFDCLIDHARGYFTDQKIADLAPLKAKVQVVREPGFNVAYWNLHERRIVRDDARWLVEYGSAIEPLYFFHFSGFRLNGSPSLSVYANRRILGDAVPRSFVAQYELQWRHVNSGHDPLAFTLVGAGLDEPIPPSWKVAFREDAEVHVRAGFTLAQVRQEIYAVEEGQDWSTCPSCGESHDNFGARVRSLLAGWACHPSLIGVPNGISAFFLEGHHEYNVDDQEQMAWIPIHFADHLFSRDQLLVEVKRAAERQLSQAVKLKLIGYFTYAAGIGQMARWTVHTLEEANIVPALERIYVGADSAEYLSYFLARKNPFAAPNASALCFINFDQWEPHIADPGRLRPDVQHVEVVWAWELEKIPDPMFELASSGVIQRVHTLSRWSADAMAQVFPVAVQTFSPFNLELFDVFERYCGPIPSDEGSPHYLLTTFDARSFLGRKNPEGAVALWQRVMADYPDHSLVIKSTSLRDLAPAELLNLIDSSPRTILMDKQMTEHEYFELLGHCDVFVSLHRSEGMGLTPIEAGLCGLPVVYTNYGGVGDFLEGGFFPVAYSLAQVGESAHAAGPYESSAWWAEPNLDDAERQLRRALDTSDAETAATLVMDRKRLQENLIAAQVNVVATARRLVDLVRPSEELVTLRTANVFEESVVLDEEPPLPQPNSIMFATVSVLYAIYRWLPSRLRGQINISLLKVRHGPHGPPPSADAIGAMGVDDAADAQSSTSSNLDDGSVNDDRTSDL